MNPDQKPADTSLTTQLTPPKAVGGRIPGDVVNRATQALKDNERSAVRRLHLYYVENDLSIAEISKLIGLSEATVSLVFRGQYQAELKGVVIAIEKFFKLQDERAHSRKLPFIKTTLTNRIFGVCDAAREFQKIAFIIGDQQIGKTCALMAYKEENNHGSTVYVRMPTGGAMANFMIEMARLLRIPEHQPVTRLRERVKAAFDDRMLLIVDEGHQCIKENGRSQLSIQCIDFIREIFDEKQCGVVICATNIFRDAMETGALQKILRQLKRRRLCTLQLPATPSREDLNLFAAAYHLPPANGAVRELEKRMVDDEALGMWLTLLRMGAKIAARKQAKMDWDHVILAHAGLKELESAK